MRGLLVIGLVLGQGAALADGLPSSDPARVALGRLLFWDKVLSGNRNISCGTCHHPDFGTSDGQALGLGEGAAGIGINREGPGAPMRRNAPGLFNLGAATALFHDGRVEVVAGGFRTPLAADLPAGLDSLLAAQVLFPVLSADEMAGHPGENDVADAVAAGEPLRALQQVAARVAALPEYRRRFGEREVGITDIANAVAAFVAFEWTSVDSPFDRAQGGGTPLAGDAALGMVLFYGEAGCSTCHSGPLQTDERFYGTDVGADAGRAEVTLNTADRFAFRTPSLRNVALTAPYGHAGQWPTLPLALAAHGPGLDAAEAASVFQFLLALTGDGAMAGRLGVPVAVPSGLAVDR